MPSADGRVFTLAASLFALLMGAYLLSYSGTFTADDEQHLVSGGQTFALTRHLAAMQMYGNPRLQGGFHEVDPALPVVGAMVYQAVSATEWGSVQAMFLLTPLWTALTAVLIFMIGRQWGYAPQLAIWPALFYGLASMAWPYAKTFFRDPLAAMFVAGAWLCFEMALAGTQSPARRGLHWAVLSSMLVGGVLSKNIVIPLIPLLVIAALVRIRLIRVDAPRHGWREVIVVGVFAAVGLALLARPQTPYLFRSSGAYFEWLARWLTAIPHSNFWPAAFGALVSPGKGLIVFAPYCLLVVLSWAVARREAWPQLLGPTVWLLLIVGAQSFFYDYRWTNPHWGARYLLPALPGLAAATLPGLDWVMRRSKAAASALIAGALGLGFLTQLPGVLVAPSTYAALVQQVDPRAFFNLAIWNPGYSAVMGHWRIVAAGQPWAVALVRVFSQDPAGVCALAVCLIAATAGAGWMLRHSMTAPALSPRHMAGAAALVIVSLGLPLGLLTVYRSDPAYFGHHPAFAAASAHLSASVAADDLVVVRGYLDPFWYYYFNYGRPRQPWVGLPTFDGPANDAPPGDPFYLPGIDAEAADTALFESAPADYGRLWFVADSSMPVATEGIDVEAWLGRHYPPIQHWEFTGTTGIRMVLFELQPSD